ncbi:MAG: hypothetical protein PHE55_18105 [Methylococcaceae bacterium]|nr:hypothetical protein [Methylococcaceae bacterium]
MSIRTKTPTGKSVLMNEAEFAAYVEHVFRHHNGVVNDLLFASNKLDSSNNAALLRAEAKMDHACHPLNEVVSSSTGGQSPSFWSELQLADAVPECEAATRRLEKLMNEEY